jgi:hemerythrin-like domain-containing protein
MSRPGPGDPIAELSHDHSDLGVLVQAVRDTVTRVERGELAWEDALQELEDGAEALREGLLVHFGREEEALFPFVDHHLPELRSRVAALLSEHDAVLSAAAELCRVVATAPAGEGSQHARRAWSAFEETYAGHAQAEHTLLRDVGPALDDEERAALRALLEAV